MKLSERIDDVFARFNDEVISKWGEEVPFGAMLALLGLEGTVIEMIRLSEQSRESNGSETE